MMNVIRKFSQHRSFDQRADGRVTSYNELMENAMITVTEHATARPLILAARNVVHDALVDKPNGRSPQSIHSDYDNRISELLNQVSEMAEREILSPTASGMIRSGLESFRPIVHDALVSNYGEGMALDTEE